MIFFLLKFFSIVYELYYLREENRNQSSFPTTLNFLVKLEIEGTMKNGKRPPPSASPPTAAAIKDFVSNNYKGKLRTT